MSGLTAAYLSPNLDWLLLEKGPHFGGNAYMMDFRGAAYGTGSAFVESPVAAEMAIQLGLEPLPIDNSTLAVRPQRKAVHVSYMQGGRITTVAAG